MGGQTGFYVVVLDDKPAVCQRMAEKLDGARGAADPDLQSRVTVGRVEIELRRRDDSLALMDDSWSFSDRVLEQLDQVSHSKPDLIIVDYFYVDPEVAAQLKAEAKAGTLSRERLLTRVLSPGDLRQWVEELPQSDHRKHRILKNLFDASCPVYLHSYTPERMTALAGAVDERKRSMARVMPNAELVHAIDTRRVFFRDDVFDWPNPNSRYDAEYYPYQLAVYFDQIVDKEILRKRLYSSRYLKIKRTAVSVAGISAIGGGIGLSSAWIGNYVASAFGAGDMVLGITVGGSLMVILLVLGMLCPFLFERLMARLMRGRTADVG